MSILRSFRGIFDRSRNDADIQEEFAFRIEAEFGKTSLGVSEAEARRRH